MSRNLIDIEFCPECYNSRLDIDNKDKVRAGKLQLDFECPDCGEEFSRVVDPV
jgi:predicted RNA-binding Zn-ribbon protein involved in translation (DUF1610 family)